MIEHPIEFVERFFSHDNTNVKRVELSRYYYYPRALFDANVKCVTAVTNLRTRYEWSVKRLAPEEELAFNSRVWVGTSRHLHEKHMPLVDFLSGDQAGVEKCSEELISELGAASAAVYHSGRSYHLYVGTLLSAPEWIRLMGRLLLLNPRGGPDVIDQRWVGHRLRGGYAALRWSANSTLHSELPRLVRKW